RADAFEIASPKGAAAAVTTDDSSSEPSPGRANITRSTAASTAERVERRNRGRRSTGPVYEGQADTGSSQVTARAATDYSRRRRPPNVRTQREAAWWPRRELTSCTSTSLLLTA